MSATVPTRQIGDRVRIMDTRSAKENANRLGQVVGLAARDEYGTNCYLVKLDGGGVVTISGSTLMGSR